MSLWDVIYDFFADYIFISENGRFDMLLDYYTISEDINIVDWLTFVSSIISLIVIVLLCCALIKKIYNMCAHIIG